MANAIAGVGTTFERWSGSAWQFIAEINAIEGPTMNKENIEVTALDTDGGYDEFITGFMEGGTLTLNMNFSRSGYELMKQDFEIDVARDYRITLPDDEDTTLEFEGLVIEIPLTMEAEDKLTVDVTIQVTGEVAIASAGEEGSEGSSINVEDVISDGNTVAWYLADDLTTITKDGSDLVSQWSDKLASGHDLLQATGTNQPLWVAPGTVRFDGVDDVMKTAAFTYEQPESIYMIINFITLTADDYAMDGNTTITGTIYESAVNIYAYAGTLSTGIPTTTGVYHIVRIVFNGANSKIQLDNNAAVTGNFGAANMGGFNLGSRIGTPKNYANIEVKEIILRNVVDSVENEDAIYNYLVSRMP